MDGDPRPEGAFLLSLLGLLFHVIVLALILAFVLLLAGREGFGVPGLRVPPLAGSLAIFLLWLATAAVLVLLGAAGTAMMNSPSPSQVRSGSVLVLIVAVVAFPTLWGFFVGSLLMFVGALLGLVWEPPSGGGGGEAT